jgi:hypothetical protein
MESIICITILTLIVQQFPVNILFGQWWKEIYCGTQEQQHQFSQHVFSLWKESHAMGIGMQDCSFWGFIESRVLLIITFFIKLVPSFFSHITNSILQTLKLLTSLSYWSKVWKPQNLALLFNMIMLCSLVCSKISKHKREDCRITPWNKTPHKHEKLEPYSH